MKVEKLIPEVYYSQSRDFSYIGRLFEILFNYIKTGADCVAINSDSPNIDATTIELIASTLGFESKHNYVTRDLIYVISSFSTLIRKKGTIDAVNTAIQLLMNSQKIAKEELIDFIGSTSFNEDFVLDIKVPSQLKDLILLEDIFEYILPTGVLYTITKVEAQAPQALTLNITSEHTHGYSINPDTSLVLSDEAGGYAYMLETSITEPGDWGIEEDLYYEYINAEESSDPGFYEVALGTPYKAGIYYKRTQNDDIGTIITGTVYDGSKS